MVAQQMAKSIGDYNYAKGDKYITYAVADVMDLQTGVSKIRVTSSSNKIDISLKKHLDNGYEGKYDFVQTDLILKKTTKPHEPYIPIFEATYGDGTIDENYTKYKAYKNPEGSNDHHAEMRLKSTIGANEKVLELVPTKKCCGKCQIALTEANMIDKVPKELWNNKARKEELKKSSSEETGKCS